MKICPKCKSEVDDNFDMCWNCEYSFSEKRIVSKTEFSETCPHCNIEVDSSYEFCPNCQHKLGINSIPSDPSVYEGALKLDCLRCKTPMFFKGTSKFHEGTRYGVFGDFFELLVNRESFDVYFCSKCGKIEFYLPIKSE